MADSSRTLHISYTGDPRGVLGAVKQIDSANATLGDKLRLTGQKITSAGKSMTKSVTLPLVAIATKGFMVADAYGDAVSTIQQHIKTMGLEGRVSFDDLNSRIVTLSNSTGVYQQDLLNAAGKITTFANVAKGGTETIARATKDAADIAAAGFGSIDSASVMLGKALDNPVKGLTALSRAGVSFSEKQANVITKLVESGQTAKAQGMIFEAVEMQVGGTAKAMVDPWDKAKNTLNNAFITIGQAVAPMVATISTKIASLASAFDKLSPGAQRIILIVAGIAAAIGPLLVVVGKLISAIGAVSKAFTFLAANPAVLIWAAIAIAVVVLAIVIYKNWDKIKAFLLKIWNSLKAAALNVWNAIKTAALAVFNAIKAPVVAYVRFYQAMWRIIVSVVRTAWDAVTGAVRAAWDRIRAIGSGILSFFRGVWDHIRDAAKAVWDGIKDAFSSAFGAIQGIARNVVNGLIRILNGALSGINKLISGFNKIPFAPDIPLIGSIPYLARGGTAQRDTLAVVGEAGPEVRLLHRGDSVLPLPRGRAGLGANVTNVVNVNATVVGSERELAQIVLREMLKMQRRSGALGLTG